MKKSATLIVTVGIITLVAFLWLRTQDDASNDGETSLIPLLSDTAGAGFSQATVPYAIDFPRDLGPHNDYQTEWWYYTGNLETLGGRQFGFQLTFFRRALAPLTADNRDCQTSNISSEALADDNRCDETSRWKTNQIYLAHFALSDISEETFYHFERFSRGAANLAGAQADPYRVFLENWHAEKIGSNQVSLFAESDDITLDLIITETLPPILHGVGGLSPKGPEPGNASYYYSLVQQLAEGTVIVEGREFTVTGLAWKDHEYSTSALSPDAVGWDWFSIQLSDGGALMFFQIRKKDGSLSLASSGTYINPDGSTSELDRQDWNLEVLDTWTSPNTGYTYPSGWRIEIPALSLVLTGQPLMPNQELTVSTTYWEGATSFEGFFRGEPIDGLGYVELTGYGEALSGRI
jgi:predicted secreted hydrolase